MCFTPMNHGHSPALPPEKQVPPRNKYRNRWTSALPKWVPKRPVKFCLPKNSMAWRMKRYVYTAISIWRIKQNKPNPGPTRLRNFFSRNSGPDVWPWNCKKYMLYVLKWEKLFPHVFWKKKLQPKILELEFLENYQFLSAFSKGFGGSHQKSVVQDTHRVLLRHSWSL